VTAHDVTAHSITDARAFLAALGPVWRGELPVDALLACCEPDPHANGHANGAAFTLRDDLPAIDLVVTGTTAEADVIGMVSANVVERDSKRLTDELRHAGRVLLVGKSCASMARECWNAGVAEVLRVHVPPAYRDLGDFLCAPTSLEGLTDADVARMTVRWAQLLYRAHLLERPAAAAGRRGWRELLDLPPVAWLVDGLIPAAGIVVMVAEPSVGKTLVAVDVSLRLAHGMTWFGRSTRPGSTLYLNGEGWHGIGARVRGWKAAHPNETERDACYVDFSPLPAISSAVGLNAIEAALSERGAPALLVADTLSLALPGVDENDAGELGTALRELVGIRDRHGCAIMLLHHLGKDTTRGAMHRVRGSSSLVAAADAVLHLRRDPADDALVIEVVKMRDGAIGPPVRLAVEVGTDGPWLRSAGEPAAAQIPDPFAELDAGVRAAVVALQKLGGRASQVDVIARAMGGRLTDSRAAVHAAVDRGAIIDIGTNAKRPVYVVPERGGSAPPIPPMSGRRTTGPRPSSSGSSGTTTGRHGTTDDDGHRKDLDP
jgi:hypothetical protein